ncbi:hypothetical protein BV898_09023 [Hypsibius exemplaris]|uniref:Secreted protein n=1 Tax=Hypsibius exemplaris TaxID=2072580 RepID=A0A1W0WNQ9_HYPEX|nr:hypothetical protein BV898_09023 [Hypsibius exemplaris]
MKGTLSFPLLIACGVLARLATSQNPSVRVEYELKKFSNARGTQQDGKKCSILGGSCNHKFTGYIDTSSPVKGWPGTRGVTDWPTLVEKKENSLILNKILSADICAGNFQVADLRVHVTDSGMTSDKLVEDFDCLSSGSIAPTELKSTWSEEKECKARYNPGNNKLTYRVRAYALPTASCGRPPARPHNG